MPKPYQIRETVAVKHPTLGTRMLVPVADVDKFEPWSDETEPPADDAGDKAPPKPQKPAAATKPAPEPEKPAAEPKPAPDPPAVDETEPPADDAGDVDAPAAASKDWTPDSVPGIGGERWKALTGAGLTTKAAVLAAGVDGVAAVIGSETIARKVVKAAEQV